MSLEDKIQQTTDLIRNQPLNHNLRLELLQLYCIDGQWDRALKIAQQFIKLNPNDNQTKALFLGNIECEIIREQVFKGQHDAPNYWGKTAVDSNSQHDLLAAYLAQDTEKLSALFFEKCESLDTLSITSNDQQETTSQFLDTDCRTAFVLEVFEQNQYFWIDINDIQEVKFKKTEFLTDLIWRRGEVLLKNQRHLACFFPVRYPFTDKLELDDQCKYSALTKWTEVGDLEIGIGQKTFSNGDIDISILDIESIKAL